MTSPQPPIRGSHFALLAALATAAVLTACAILGTVTP